MRRLSIPLAAALAAIPLDAAAQAKTAEPAAAAPRRFVNLHDLSCEQYMALEDTLRPPVVWYIAGDYKAAGPLARSFDPEVVPGAGAAVWTECKNHPQANLRYVVMGYFKASKARADERAAKDAVAAKADSAKGRKAAPPAK